MRWDYVNQKHWRFSWGKKKFVFFSLLLCAFHMVCVCCFVILCVNKQAKFCDFVYKWSKWNKCTTYNSLVLSICRWEKSQYFVHSFIESRNCAHIHAKSILVLYIFGRMKVMPTRYWANEATWHKNICKLHDAILKALFGIFLGGYCYTKYSKHFFNCITFHICVCFCLCVYVRVSVYFIDRIDNSKQFNV